MQVTHGSRRHGCGRQNLWHAQHTVVTASAAVGHHAHVLAQNCACSEALPCTYTLYPIPYTLHCSPPHAGSALASRSCSAWRCVAASHEK